MKKQFTLAEQEELFTRECKLINLQYEYTGYMGQERWAIITELSEEDLFLKYPDVVNRYIPFVLLSVAQGEVIYESKRNDDKYDKRNKRTLDAYGYEDDISQLFHKELVVPYIDPIEAEENARLDEERKMQRNIEIAKVRKVLSMLQPIQKQRLLKHIVEGKTVREIAREEGTYHSSVIKSINAAIKNFKKFYGNL